MVDIIKGCLANPRLKSAGLRSVLGLIVNEAFWIINVFFQIFAREDYFTIIT
jgi:hypothetical protein